MIQKDMQGLGEGRRISSGLTEVIHCAFDFNLITIVLRLFCYIGIRIKFYKVYTPFLVFCDTGSDLKSFEESDHHLTSSKNFPFLSST